MKNGGASALRNRGRVAVIATALMMTSALVPVMFATPAFAQAASATTAGQNGIEGQYAFDIPAQSLTSALAQFGVQTGLQVTVDGALARDVQAGAVSGTMRADTALETLLQGTGLSFDVTSDGTVVIEPLVTGEAAQGEVLDPVRVEANASDVTGPKDAITESFVASRSVTGSKTNTQVLDDPASVSVITQKEMETRNVQDMQQALAYTSGVAVDEYGSDDRFDYVRIRGFGETTNGVYRDGLPNHVPGWTVSRVEPYGLQQIDILKGSTSTLFGMNAPGGLANGITKRPEDDARGEVFTTFGENHLTTGGDVTGPVAEDSKWTYRLTALWQDAERAQDYSRDDRLYVAPAFTYKPKAGTELTILTDYSKRESSLAYGVPRGVDIDPNTFLGEPDFNKFNTEQYEFGYDFKHLITDRLEFRQIARYTNVELEYRQVAAESSSPTANRTAYKIDGEMSNFAIDNQFEYDRSWDTTDAKTLVGFDYNRIDNRETAKYGTATGIGFVNPVYCGVGCINANTHWTDWDIEQNAYGLYAQEQLTLDDTWIVTLGGRYDYVQSDTYYVNNGTTEENDQQSFTTRAGLTYKVTPDVSVYGNYSESFLPVYNSITSVEGEVKPQEGTQYEVGIKYQPEAIDAMFTLAAFDLTQTNVPYNVTSNVKSQIGEINTRGIEFEGKMSLTDQVNMTVAYTYLDAEIVNDGNGTNDGNRPQQIPEHTASAWVDYTVPGQGWRGDLTFGSGVRFAGPSYGDNANQVDIASHTVFDAAINYRITENVNFAINATNLFDREYVTTSYNSVDYYGDGRTVLGTLKYSW
ncbi:TonB-dependent siderophore receptor [Thalassospira sp.]|uniref:TonB-dependent siderophore receptor n=1 Tax=Thalassospira sp. TaxID=1912094 RepID=UPI0032ED2C8E